MLAIHRSYLSVIDEILHEDWLTGIAHITGGGIVENTQRIINTNHQLEINWQSWERPAIFNLIQEIGNVPEDDMKHSMNLGIGLILIVNAKGIDKLISHFDKYDESYIELGAIK